MFNKRERDENEKYMDFVAEKPPSPVAVVVAAEIVVDC